MNSLSFISQNYCNSVRNTLIIMLEAYININIIFIFFNYSFFSKTSSKKNICLNVFLFYFIFQEVYNFFCLFLKNSLDFLIRLNFFYLLFYNIFYFAIHKNYKEICFLYMMFLLI